MIADIAGYVIITLLVFGFGWACGWACAWAYTRATR